MKKTIEERLSALETMQGYSHTWYYDPSVKDSQKIIHLYRELCGVRHHLVMVSRLVERQSLEIDTLMEEIKEIKHELQDIDHRVDALEQP